MLTGRWLFSSNTVLQARDQAALHGVLAQIEALGLELLEVRRLDS
jgi:hypothetical protein